MAATYPNWKGVGSMPYLRPQEFRRLMFWAEKALQVKGDFCEFGVFKGGGAGQLCLFLKQNDPSRMLYLFDAWEDKPNIKRVVKKWEQNHGLTMTKTSYEKLTKKNIDDVDPLHLVKIQYCKGLFCDTSPKITSPVAFIHFDADLYQSCKDTLDFAHRNLVKGGIIVFHDALPFGTWKGVNKAIATMSVDKYEVLRPEHNLKQNNQIVAIKR